jgi:hypothetical protein
MTVDTVGHGTIDELLGDPKPSFPSLLHPGGVEEASPDAVR